MARELKATRRACRDRREEEERRWVRSLTEGLVAVGEKRGTRGAEWGGVGRGMGQWSSRRKGLGGAEGEAGVRRRRRIAGEEREGWEGGPRACKA